MVDSLGVDTGGGTEKSTRRGKGDSEVAALGDTDGREATIGYFSVGRGGTGSWAMGRRS
jgi:hypothetical protein